MSHEEDDDPLGANSPPSPKLAPYAAPLPLPRQPLPLPPPVQTPSIVRINPHHPLPFHTIISLPPQPSSTAQSPAAAPKSQQLPAPRLPVPTLLPAQQLPITSAAAVALPPPLSRPPSVTGAPIPTATSSSSSSAPQRDEALEFMRRPLPNPRLTVGAVSASCEGLVALAKDGSWRAVLQLSHDMLASHGVAPHTRASIRCLRLFSLMRMRMPSTVTAELSVIGDLNAPEWHFEHYPLVYPQRAGSFASFELRLLRAIGITNSGAQNSSYNHVMDPLYELLGQLGATTFFQDESDTSALTCLRLTAELGVTAIAGEDRASLQRRCVVMAILRQHFIRGEFISCVRLVQAELQSSSGDMPLRWWMVRLSISMGDLQSARKHVAEAISADSSPSASNSFDALMHSGLVAVACAQYPAALEFFDRALRLKPANSAAAVNLSISQLYCKRLGAAISNLEDRIREYGGDFLDSSVVANLAGL